MAYVGPFTLIVPVGVAQNSGEVFGILDPDSGGISTFRVRLSANGLEPASHLAARTMLEEATHNALTTMTTTQFQAYVNSLATQRGRGQLASSTAFKNGLIIGVADFNAALTAAGLKRIQVAL